MTTKQINISVPEATKRKIDELINKINATLLNSGCDAISKGDFVLAGLWKYLTDNLGMTESMDWAKRKAMSEKATEDFRKILEEALNV
jgi:hypothetical protein